ncbi:MAG TPA: ATP-binding protein [Allosphingosinicella sp.]|jgi:signal transduction histidine kinase|nr:ATP-binding protein [Allosphingosinicella sp.]
MRPVTRLADRWPNVPIAAGIMALLLLAIGLAVVFQNESAYREQKLRETTIQADILAASVTAALDFGDAATAQEAVDALRVNPQIDAAGVYDRDGARFAGYERRAGALPEAAGTPRGGADTVAAMVPVLRGGERIGSVYLGAMREPVSRRLTRYGFIGLLVAMAVLVVLILGISQTALRRAKRELEARAEALSGAYAELQVQVEERAHAEEQLRQAQKMQALGQLTGGIAHDFNNLLTVIQGSADILRRPGIAEAKRIRFADAIVQTAGRAAALTGQLLAFARRQPLQPEVIDLNAKIAGMTDLLDRTLGERVEIRTDLAEGLCAIEVDPAQLESAILNVAVNARDAMPEGGALTLHTGQAPPLADGRQAIFVAVSDNGTGIDEEALGRVFEPFFTTKSVGKGTGLGLSQVYGFATQTGGDVRVESVVGEGTTVTLILPCSERAVAPPRPEAPAGRRHRTGRILLVDDNEEVGAFAETLLTELGHRVTRARTGAEALGLARAGGFDAVFTDVVMPGMSGIELADALAPVLPGIPVVLTTGYSDEITRAGGVGRPVVFKPYRLETLAGVLDEVLAPKEDGNRHSGERWNP